MNVVGKSVAFIDLLGHHHHHNHHSNNNNKHHNRVNGNNNNHIKVYNSESIDEEYFKSQYEDNYDYADRFNGRQASSGRNRTSVKHQYQTNKSSRVADNLESSNGESI